MYIIKQMVRIQDALCTSHAKCAKSVSSKQNFRSDLSKSELIIIIVKNSIFVLLHPFQLGGIVLPNDLKCHLDKRGSYYEYSKSNELVGLESSSLSSSSFSIPSFPLLGSNVIWSLTPHISATSLLDLPCCHLSTPAMYLGILWPHLRRTSISFLVNAHVSAPYSRTDLTQASYTLPLVLSPMLQFTNKLAIFQYLLHAAVTLASTVSPLLLHSPAHLPSNKTVLLPPTCLHLLPTRDPHRLHSHHHPPPLMHILDIQSSAPLGDFSDLSIVCNTINFIALSTQHRVCSHSSSTASTCPSSWPNPVSSIISSHHWFCHQIAVR